MVQQASRPTADSRNERKGCPHHWLIETPVGPVSKGTCRLCGQLNEFKNYVEASPWGEEAAPAKKIEENRSPTSDGDDSEEYQSSE